MKIWCCTLRKWYLVDRNKEVGRSCRSDGGHGIESFRWVRPLLGRVCGLSLCCWVISLGGETGRRLGERRSRLEGECWKMSVQKWPLQVMEQMGFSWGHRMKKRERVHVGTKRKFMVESGGS